MRIKKSGMRPLFAASMLLLATACDAGQEDDMADETAGAAASNVGPGPAAEAFAELKVRGHTISFYDEGHGTLGVAERSPIGEPALLAGVRAGASPSEIFAQLGAAPVPEAVLEYERRHRIVSSLAADQTAAEEAHRDGAGGFAILKHEAGPVHFDQSHCPQEPYAAVWSGFTETYQRTQAQSRTNIVTRKFCWSAGHTGTWTESSTAAVMSNAVAAVSGSVCFTRTKDTGSASWTIMQGEQLNYNTYNRPALWSDSCPSGAVCSSLHASVNAPLTATVGCTEAGDVWRWGGIFKKHQLTGFRGYY